MTASAASIVHIAKAPPAEPDEDRPRDYAYRHTPPLERQGQLTRLGDCSIKRDDARLASLQWFILRTAPMKEMVSTVLLERMGCAVLYPRELEYRQLNRYKRAKFKVLKPLAVGYLFVGFASDPNWHRVTSLPSLSGVVGVMGKPLRIRFDHITHFLNANVDTIAPPEQKFMRTGREFGLGDIVEILDGPMRGEHVRVKTIKGRFAKALLSFGLGGEASATIPLDNLARVG